MIHTMRENGMKKEFNVMERDIKKLIALYTLGIRSRILA
jgi:hypothetical protein